MQFGLQAFSEDFAKNLKFFTQKQVPKAITIYMPTNRVWTETHKDKTRFKKFLEEADKELISFGIRSTDAKVLTKQAKKLLRREDFWKGMRDGLAVFISENFFKYYKLDKRFEPITVVQDYFYLTPLATLIERYPDYYVLTISQNNVELYKGSYGALEYLKTHQVPEDINKALWTDDTDTASYQMREEKKDKHKNRLARFVRVINREVNEVIADKSLPMIVACVDFFYPIYRNVNTYPYLLDEYIEGNPENMLMAELAQDSWDIIKNLLNREIQEDIRKYRNMFHTKKALKNIKDIVTSSYQARLEALFVEPDQRVWGNFLEDDNRVIVNSEKAPDNEELLNLSLINTLRNGGKVYSLSEIKGLTNGNQPFTGILRY